jgi:cullin 1
VFQTFYTTKLSKRLIHGLSASDENERSMVSKLQVACGSDYTNRLQRMFTGAYKSSKYSSCSYQINSFTDLSLSKDLTEEFKEHILCNHGDVDIGFNIMVLGTNLWPLNHPNHDFVIPVEILPIYDRFQGFYQRRHSGRKLKWLWNYSKNELWASYLDQKYILVMSSYQMAVLLQYNENDTLSLSEMVSTTAINKETLVQVLAPLVKAKILTNEDADQYQLNLSL